MSVAIAEWMSRPDTQFLNLFRALAALWVVVGHCAIWSGVKAFPAPGMAVDLFMVISGFLMMFTVDGTRRGEGWAWEFYLRRFFRIAPAYYVALVMVFFLQRHYHAGMLALGRDINPDLLDFPPIDGANLAMHLSFLFGLVPQYADSTMLPDWSLSLEMQFYAVFPAIYVVARTCKFLPIAIGLTVFSVAARIVYYRLAEAGLVGVFREPSLLLFCLPMFLFGILIHEARNKGTIWGGLAIAGLTALEVRAHGLAGFSVVTLVALLALCWLRGIRLRSWIVDFASSCSYSVYLIHGFVLFLVGPMVPGVVGRTFMVIALSYGLSWLSFRYIELPGIALGKRFAKRRFAAPPMV
jgi:peptidoglycan/LPS O-acetylase OafA/YrhL